MATEPSNSPLTGLRLGVYHLQELIGAGGMGEVYRARDTRLGRDVAIKILPAALTGSEDRVARFEREARVLAALNHSNIATIHGLEEGSGVRGLVMELVEGDTVADRLISGPLTMSEALVVARQIADALEAAHEKGIIHRDLKPANIKVTTSGTVKVLDFGLAKAVASDDGERAQTPTITLDRTREGLIAGTLAYMSPEQARGQPVDKRTDIWAFGCVLFELLTGRSPFAAETGSDTIAAILNREPNWNALPPATPDDIRRLLRRCLEKDSRRRLHDIADARLDLEDAMAMRAATVPRAARSRIARLSLWLALLATGVVLATVFSRFRVPPAPTPPSVQVNRLTDLTGLEESPAISPDGRSVAFTAYVGNTRHLFIQLVARGSPLQLTRDPGDHQFPRWSGDSSSIVYFSPAASGEIEGALWEMPALGGQPRRLTDSLGGADLSATDGRLAFFRLAGKNVELVTASIDGANSQVVATLPPVTYYLYPRWSPDGRWIAFQRGDSVRFDLFVVAAAGGEPRQLTHDNTMISGFDWMPDGTSIVYSSSRSSTMPYLPTANLWQVQITDGRLRQLTSGESSYAYPDVSAHGAIVVGRMRMQTDVWKYPIAGSPDANTAAAVRITTQTGQILTPTAGPGDKEVAFLSDSGGHANLWVINTETKALRQITHEQDPRVALGVPVWSPDGRSIAFVYSRGNPGLSFGVWLVNPDGSNLRQVANPGLGPAWSFDGRWLYFSTRGTAKPSDIVMQKISADGGTAVTVRQEQLRNVIGSDGTSLYYVFERPLVDGRPEFEIRVAKPENAPHRVLARIPASRVPIWQVVNPALSPDGQLLAQALTDGPTTNIWTLSTSGTWRQVTDFKERPIFIARRVSWSSDGRHILAAVGEGDSDIVLIEGLTSSGPNK